MSRFCQVAKTEGLQFDYNAYDVVSLSDGTKAIITGYGIYNNQYWCELPESRTLGVADWFSVNNNSYGKHIDCKINDQSTINDIKRKYLNKLIEMKEDFNINNETYNKEILLVQSMLE